MVISWVDSTKAGSLTERTGKETRKFQLKSLSSEENVFISRAVLSEDKHQRLNTTGKIDFYQNIPGCH